MNKKILESVALWAEEKVEAGHEPPWSEETLEQFSSLARKIISSMEATISLRDSLELHEHQESGNPRVGNIVQLDNARFRRDLPANLQLPM